MNDEKNIKLLKIIVILGCLFSTCITSIMAYMNYQIIDMNQNSIFIFVVIPLLCNILIVLFLIASYFVIKKWILDKEKKK